MKDKILAAWQYAQSLMHVDGALYVDAFAVVMLIRLLAPLKGYSPMTTAEAGTWAATIASLAYSKGGPKQS